MCYVACAHAFSSNATLLAIVASVLSAKEATYTCSVLLLCQFYVTFHYGIQSIEEWRAAICCFGGKYIVYHDSDDTMFKFNVNMMKCCNVFLYGMFLMFYANIAVMLLIVSSTSEGSAL